VERLVCGKSVLSAVVCGIQADRRSLTLEFHDADTDTDTDILDRILTDTSDDTPNFLKLFHVAS